MKIKPFLLLAGLVMLLLSACATEAEPMASFDMAAPEMAAEAEAIEGDFNTSFSGEALERVNLQSQEGPERLIIRTGDVSIVVEDSETSARDIAQLADSLGGWMVESDLHEFNGAKRGSVTIRVPADQFDLALAEIKSLALEVNAESTSSQDVTEEYIDLESRLTNLEATADRVRAFLDEARNVEEALEVNRELSRLESEIEVIKGRMQYLRRSAAFSVLTVHLTPDELNQPIEIGGWRPEGVAKDAIEALVSALQALANVAIWGAIFCLPLALLAGVPLYFIGRAIYRRRKGGRAAQESGPEAAESDAAEEVVPEEDSSGETG